MSRHDPDRHWIQIHSSSYPDVLHIACHDHAHPTNQFLHGPDGVETWQLNPNTEVDVISDEHLRVAGRTLTAQLNHLPTPAYRALVDASGNFRQYDGAALNTLECMMRQPIADWDPAVFGRLLEETLRAGRQLDRQPRLVVAPTTYTAQWEPREIYLRRTPKGHWLLSLTFHSQFHPQPGAPTRVRIGLDLGRDPLTVAYTSVGGKRTFPATALNNFDPAQLQVDPSEAARLLRHLRYAAGRRDAEGIIAYLNHYASTVFAEKLTHSAMNRGFVSCARNLAIHDHHFSTLSQYLNTSRVPFHRVDSRYTSQTCAHCRVHTGGPVLGTREGATFRCPHCRGTYNAHENAARNILLLGDRVHPAGSC